jgi:hypothetical protein
MSTEIRLVEGESITVGDEYRNVYDKLLATGWREPCEFEDGDDGERAVTVNPTYIVYFRPS